MVPVGERWQLIIIGLPLPCPSFHIPSRGAAWETVKAGSLLPRCESCKGTVHPPLQEEWSVEKQNTLSDIPTCSRKQEHPGGRSVTHTFSEQSTLPPCLGKFRGNSFLKHLFYIKCHKVHIQAHIQARWEACQYMEAYRWHLKLSCFRLTLCLWRLLQGQRP